MNNNSTLILATIFAELCDSESSSLSKVSFIRKIPKGYWGVFSHKGKLLGKYRTKEQAAKRLRQIEFFKYKKASEEVTYSSLIRDVSKRYSPEILREFRTVYKDTFDNCLINGDENPEETALIKSVDFLNGLDENMAKVASAIEMGDPVYAGKYIAEIIKFLMRRISPDRRVKSLNNLRHKIFKLNEFEIGQKKMPASSSLGQAISLTKNLLMMHAPNYVRAVLNSIVSNL